MTVSLGSTFPGFTSANAPAELAAAGEKGENSGFGNLVDGGKSTRRDKQQSAMATPRDLRWVGLPARLAGAEGKGEPEHPGVTKTRSAKTLATKTAKDDADDKPPKTSTELDQARQGTSAEPLQELPLLMTFHELRHFSTKAAGPDITPNQAELDQPVDGQAGDEPQQSSPRNYRSIVGVDDHETTSRSERSVMPTGFLAEHRGQQSYRSGLAADSSGHQADPASLAPTDQAAADISGPQAKQIEKQALPAARIDIVAEQSFPAPAQNAMSQATSTVISTIASDNGLRQALSTPSAHPQMASSVAVPTHILKIELHPAELGVVTASLRLAGAQLSIELKPESHEAYRSLASDSEAIVKSLRGLGFDVDKVTILQPSIAVPAPTRTEASGSLPPSAGREQASFQPGNSSGNNDGSGRQQSGRNRNDDTQEFGRAAPLSRDRAGDDMFI
jgi:chemotaxis protein MotD